MKGGRANEIDVHIGKRLRMRRLMLDMSQEALAKEIGLTFQQVQKYEKGSNRISASRIQQIADALQISVSFLYDGMPRKKVAIPDGAFSSIEKFLSTKDGLALTLAFSQLRDQKVRRGILNLVQMIAVENKPKRRRGKIE